MPGHINSPLLNLEFAGAMTLTTAGATGSFDVTAKGLDRAVASLKDMSDDPTAGKVLAFLTLAQTFGEQSGDGSTHFLIERKDDGSVTVNGKPLMPPPGQPL